MAAPPATESTAQDSRLLCACPESTRWCPPLPVRGTHKLPLLLEEESTDLGGAQAVSGGARGGHQDYHRAAWPGDHPHIVSLVFIKFVAGGV